MWLRSLLHNFLAAGGATVILPIASAVAGALTQGPTGGALAYASTHPYVDVLYAGGALFLREILKTVPGLAPATASAAGPNTSAVQSSAGRQR